MDLINKSFMNAKAPKACPLSDLLLIPSILLTLRRCAFDYAWMEEILLY